MATVTPSTSTPRRRPPWTPPDDATPAPQGHPQRRGTPGRVAAGRTRGPPWCHVPTRPMCRHRPRRRRHRCGGVPNYALQERSRPGIGSNHRPTVVRPVVSGYTRDRLPPPTAPSRAESIPPRPRTSIQRPQCRPVYGHVIRHSTPGCCGLVMGVDNMAGLPDLAEGERVGLDLGVEEGDLEGAVGNGTGLPEKLVQPMFGHRSVTLVVHIDPMCRARRLSVEKHAESYGRVPYARAHDQVEVAGVEAVANPPVGLVQRGSLFRHRPVPGQSPVIESQLRRDRIDLTLAQHRATGGREILGALIAGVVLW